MRRILIVDDNKMFRRTMKQIFCNYFSDFFIAEAADGAEAVKQIKLQAPELVLMDIHLPGESGLKVTEKIKAIWPETRVVFITAYDSDEYRDVAFQLGAEGFLSKNRSSTENIISKIKSVLRES